MSDLPPTPADLPEVLVVALDDAAICELLADLEAEATLLGVTVKAGPTRMADEHLAESHAELVRLHLHPLAAALNRGEREALPRGLQLRYAHEGRVVYDTLIRQATGWRLTRLAPPHAQPRG